MKELYILIIALLTFNVANAQWFTVANNVSDGDLHGLYFVNSKLGFVCGESSGYGVIYKTTNGGTTWNKVYQTTSTVKYIYDVFFVDANNGFAVGVDAFYKTVDGGTNWTSKIFNGVSLKSVFFLTSSTGYAVGDGSPEGPIYKTTDGGNTWVAQQSGAKSFLNDVFFIDASNGYTVGDYDILKTTDGGASWMNVSYSANTNERNAVYCIDANTCYVASSICLLKTVEGGTSWINQYNQEPLMDSMYYFTSVFFTNSVTGYVPAIKMDVEMTGMGKAFIFKTMDGGNNWYKQNALPVGAIYFPVADTGFAVGQNGLVLKTNNGGGITSTEDNFKSKNNDINIYPNPASDFVTLRINRNNNTNTTMDIYNVMGSLVKTDTFKQNQQQINISNLKNGIYIVEIKSKGLIEKQKLVVQR